MSDEHDLIRDMTQGADTDAPAGSHPCIVVEEKCINSIEADESEKLTFAIQELGLPPIFLDETGELGYVSDGPADNIKAFDRRSFEVTASIRSCPGPRAIALETDSGLLVAICPAATPPAEQPPTNRRPGTRPAQSPPPPKASAR